MKKVFITIGVVGVAILATLILLYCIDMNRIKNNEEILSSTWGLKYVPPIQDNVNITKEENFEFIGTILEETTTYMIVKPNEDEEEAKSSDKIVIHYGTDHIDYLYGIGRKVLIQYDGFIQETYPAQIHTNNIKTDGYEEFILSVQESKNKSNEKILNNKELYEYNSDYNLYYYGLNQVNITINEKTITLEQALREGKITIDGIISKANTDVNNQVIKSEMYKEGGTIEYYYPDYTIIKCHSLDGNRDVYIGIPEMRLKDIK